MKNINFGLCVWNIWGDEVVDRPDNIDETITAEMIRWLVDNTGLNYVYQFQPLQYPKPKVFQGIIVSSVEKHLILWWIFILINYPIRSWIISL